MRSRWLLWLLFSVAAPPPAAAGAPAHRPTGSRPIGSQQARRRVELSERTRHVGIRPAGRKASRLTSPRAAHALARVMAARPDRTLEQLAPGLERYRAVVGRMRSASRAHPGAVRVTRAGRADGLSILRVDLLSSRPATERRPRVLIVAGAHAGRERVSVEAAARFVELAARDEALRANFDITVVPLLTPGSLVVGSRENPRRLNVNRTFASGKWTPESLVIRDIADREHFDLVVDLHGAGDAGRNGFFLIREGDDGGMSARALSAMGSGELMDVAGAAGAPTSVGPYHFEHLGDATSSNEGTLTDYLRTRGARYVYTLEAPTRADPGRQLRGTLKLLHSLMNNTRRHGVLGRDRE